MRPVEHARGGAWGREWLLTLRAEERQLPDCLGVHDGLGAVHEDCWRQDRLVMNCSMINSLLADFHLSRRPGNDVDGGVVWGDDCGLVILVGVDEVVKEQQARCIEYGQINFRAL